MRREEPGVDQLRAWSGSLARHGSRTSLEQAADQVVGADPLGPGLEVQDQPVPEDRMGDRPDVGEVDVEPAREDRPGLGPEDQVLRGPGAPAVGQELLDLVARSGPSPGLGREAPTRFTA